MHIKSLKPKKSPGLDGITNIALQRSPGNLILLLTNIINAILCLGYFPRQWKKAAVVPIHKAGSDPTIPANYRPISLLSSASKIAEKVILQRLADFLKENNTIINEQFGFRRKHSTTHQLLRVAELIHQNFAIKSSTAILFLDIARAFDKVWIQGLVHKLIKLQIPNMLVKIIHNYLTNRSFCVRYNGLLSSFCNILSSVPQGSLLGPTLFNIYLNDIPHHHKTQLAMYADDTAIISTSKNLNYLTKQIQSHITILEDYFTQWKIKLNTSKSEFVIFTKQRTWPNHTLSLGDTIIHPAKQAKYLGAILDMHLTWKDHLTKALKKYHIVRNILNPIISNRKLSTNTKILLFKMALRPILLYACPVWGSAAPYLIRRIQSVQNQFCKKAARMPWYVRSDLIQAELGVNSVPDEIKKQAKHFFNNIHLVGNTLLDNIPDYDLHDPNNSRRPRVLTA